MIKYLLLIIMLIISSSYAMTNSFGQGKVSSINPKETVIILAPVRVRDLHTGKWGYINKTGKFIINPQFQQAEPFSEGLAEVRITTYTDAVNNKCGYINKKGDFQIPPMYNYATSFSDGLALTQVNYESILGYIDKNNNTVIEPIFELFSGNFSEGLAFAISDKGMGFINKYGESVASQR